jgi:hypothetical protein
MLELERGLDVSGEARKHDWQGILSLCAVGLAKM